MALAAEPRRASLPLPGGRQGAAVRLHPLLVATMSAPPGILHRHQGSLAGLRGLGVGVPRNSYVELPVGAFLVEHPGAGPVLIDTGFHGSVAIDPVNAMGRLGALIFKSVEMEPGHAVPDQLRGLGVEPAAIETIVLTHLHADNVGGIGHFPEATLVLDEAEWHAAVAGGERDGYVKRWFDHAFDYRLLDFRGTDAASFASFGHALDLFGDASVVLVSTPGHSEGHLSVVLRLAGGREALIAGGAVPTAETLRTGDLPGKVADEHRFKRSLREIQLYVEQTPSALIVPGLDLPCWRGLDPAY